MICVIDNDDSVRASLLRLLRSTGMRAQGFASAEDFLGAAPREDCPCIIIDVHMDGMGGLELQKVLRERGTVPRIVMISGREEPAIRKQAIEAGAAAFLRKPFDDSALFQAIAAIEGELQADGGGACTH